MLPVCLLTLVMSSRMLGCCTLLQLLCIARSLHGRDQVNVWFHLLCSVANRQCHCKGPAAHFGTCPILRPCSSNPFFVMRLVTPTCVCLCVCVCCGRVILPCLTQSTSVTCCNPEHHLQDNVKSTAASSPPCTPSVCSYLHTAPPLHDYACEARHSNHDFKSAAIPKQCSFAFIASHQRPSAMLSRHTLCLLAVHDV